MQTSMCIVSDFVVVVFFNLVFFFLLLSLCCYSIALIPCITLIRLNSGNYSKSWCTWFSVSEKRISHVLKLMILNFTPFNRITMSLVYNFIAWHLIHSIFHFVKSFRYTQDFWVGVTFVHLLVLYYLHDQLSLRIFYCYRTRIEISQPHEQMNQFEPSI